MQLLTIFVLLATSACVCNGDKFVMIKGTFEFAQAQLECESRGMRMAVIYNSDEQEEVENSTKIDDHSGCTHLSGVNGCRVWIGYRRVVKDGSFCWIDGQSTFEYFWRHKYWEPTNPYRNEGCVEMNYRRNKWSKNKCNARLSVLCERKSIAQGKPARQDSAEFDGDAGRAVDGNRNGDYFSGQGCTHTSAEGPHFWTVDLKASFRVTKIRITNRQDCCADRLTGLEFYVTEDEAVETSEGNDAHRCATYDGPPTHGRSITVSCEKKGRHVSILKSSGVLSLCEVEVF